MLYPVRWNNFLRQQKGILILTLIIFCLFQMLITLNDTDSDEWQLKTENLVICVWYVKVRLGLVPGISYVIGSFIIVNQLTFCLLVEFLDFILWCFACTNRFPPLTEGRLHTLQCLSPFLLEEEKNELVFHCVAKLMTCTQTELSSTDGEYVLTSVHENLRMLFCNLDKMC